jgi:hypothetical protein
MPRRNDGWRVIATAKAPPWSPSSRPLLPRVELHHAMRRQEAAHHAAQRAEQQDLWVRNVLERNAAERSER